MGPVLCKYAVTLATADRIALPLITAAGTGFYTGALSAGDVKVSIDFGAQANIGTLPTYSNGQFIVTLTGSELTGKVITVTFANAAILPDSVVIHTFGNASAKYPPIYNGGSAGNPLTSGSGADQLNVSSGNLAGAVPSVTGAVGSVTGAAGSVTGAVGSVTGNVGGNVVGSTASVSGAVGSVTGNVGGNVNGNVTGNVGGSVASVTGAVGSVTGSVGSVAGSVGGDVAGKVLGGGASSISGDGARASSVSGAVGSVTGAVGSVTGAVGSVAGGVGGDVAGKVLGGGAGSISGDGVRAASVTGAVGSVTGAVGSVTGAVGSVTAGVALTSGERTTLAGVIWATLTSGLTTVGSIGKWIIDKLDVAVSSISGGGGSALGSGANECTLNFKDQNGANIINAHVWVTSDASGATVVAGTLATNDVGDVTFLLDAGSTYYAWMFAPGENAVLARSFVAAAD